MCAAGLRPMRLFKSMALQTNFSGLAEMHTTQKMSETGNLCKRACAFLHRKIAAAHETPILNATKSRSPFVPAALAPTWLAPDPRTLEFAAVA